MTVYVMIDVMDTKIRDKVIGVYSDEDSVLVAATKIISDDGPLFLEVLSDNVYAVVNRLHNPWFYVYKKDVTTLEWGGEKDD